MIEMKLWVIKMMNKNSKYFGKYVSGDKYTKLLNKADVFLTREDARLELWETGERPVAVRATLRVEAKQK